MTATSETLNDLRAILDYIEGRLADATIEEAVELGAVLWLVIKDAERLQMATKDVIREDAVRRLNGEPGTVTIDGTDKGHASVTIPTPKLRLRKDADFIVLGKILGDDLDLYFDSKTTYKPRPIAADLVAQLPDGPQKTVLLATLEEVEGTPPVSFKHS